jgi:hypothetical protein
LNAVRFDAHPPLCQQRLGGRVLAWIRDGLAAFGVGVFLLGAVLAGAVEWLVRDESQLGVFAWLAGAGATLIVIGLAQREVARRRRRAAITVTAQDLGGASDGIDLAESAVHYCRQTSELTLTVGAELTGDAATDWSIAQQMLARTNCAIRQANRFKRDSTRVNLVPTMRLHIGFWLGAKLGRSPSKPIGLLQPKGGAGDDSYFLATVVARPGTQRRRRLWPVGSPFEVRQVDLTDSDRPRVALVVRTTRRGPATDEQLTESLRALGIGTIVWFRLKADELPNTTRACTRAIKQVRREWPARLPNESTVGYLIYLDTTVSIAVALGAYLAGPNPGLWTAYTQHRDTGEPIPFPPTRAGS